MGRSADRQIGRSAESMADRMRGRKKSMPSPPWGRGCPSADGRVRGLVPHDVMWPSVGSRNKATMITGRSNRQTASKANATAHLPICRSADLPICPSAYLPICPSAHLPAVLLAICLSAYLPTALLPQQKPSTPTSRSPQQAFILRSQTNEVLVDVRVYDKSGKR